MMNIQLTIFEYKEENNLSELATVEINGEVWFVAADVCNLLGLTSVTESLRPLDDDEKLTSEILRAGQKRRVNLINESGLYALIFRSKKPTALKFRKWVTKEVIPSIRKTGAYVQAPINLLSTYTERILSEPTKHVPKGYWSIFDKSHKIMLLIEKHLGSVNEYDLADGSIGKMWSNFRKGKDWATEPMGYLHEYADKRGSRVCKCYQKVELDYFEDWLLETYKPNHLYNYLYNKYKVEKNVVMLSKVETLLPKLLATF